MRRRASASANSFLRRARALFSERIRAAILKELGIEPLASPFNGVELAREASHKHFSTVDIERLIEAARVELAGADPEAFKVIVLAFFLGLRRREIDLLEWTSFDWQRHVLRVQPTAYFTGKTHGSETELPLEPELTSSSIATAREQLVRSLLNLLGIPNTKRNTSTIVAPRSSTGCSLGFEQMAFVRLNHSMN